MTEEDLRAKSDIAAELAFRDAEIHQLRALVREAIELVDPNTDPMDESAYCDWLEKARALVSPEAAEEGRK
jgi:hypothetical protein